jgi:hypothetical protein
MLLSQSFKFLVQAIHSGSIKNLPDTRYDLIAFIRLV